MSLRRNAAFEISQNLARQVRVWDFVLKIIETWKVLRKRVTEFALCFRKSDLGEIRG